MKLSLRTVTTIAALALLAVGCSKSDAAPSSTSTTTSASGADGCASKLVTLKGGSATDADKKLYGSLCESLSSKARTCIAGAKDNKDMDACVTEKADKEKLFAAIMGAAIDQEKASAGKTNATKIDKLGLQIDLPGEVNVGDGIGKKDVMVMGSSIGGMTIGEATGSSPKNLKAAKSEAAMFKPKNVQGEATADGYWLTFENTGSLGTNYWVKTRKQLNGKAYECAGSVDTPDKATAVLAACKTLRP